MSVSHNASKYKVKLACGGQGEKGPLLGANGGEEKKTGADAQEEGQTGGQGPVTGPHGP